MLTRGLQGDEIAVIRQASVGGREAVQPMTELPIPCFLHSILRFPLRMGT